jgi:hypothetical protein
VSLGGRKSRPKYGEKEEEEEEENLSSGNETAGRLARS